MSSSFNSKWWETPPPLGQAHTVLFKASKIKAVCEVVSPPGDSVLLPAIKADGAHRGYPSSTIPPSGVVEVSAGLPYRKLCAIVLYQLWYIYSRKLWRKGQPHLFLLCRRLTRTLHSIDDMEAVLMKHVRRMRPCLVKLQWNAVPNFLLIKCYK